METKQNWFLWNPWDCLCMETSRESTLEVIKIADGEWNKRLSCLVLAFSWLAERWVKVNFEILGRFPWRICCSILLNSKVKIFLLPKPLKNDCLYDRQELSSLSITELGSRPRWGWKWGGTVEGIEIFFPSHEGRLQRIGSLWTSLPTFWGVKENHKKSR